MTRQAISKLVIASIVTTGLSGCQTASRWAWWNRGDGESTVAQSAAPTLPSAAATPQAVDVPGLEPASSPSAANLAAAQSPGSVPNRSLPAASDATIANAPFASYSTTNAAPVSSAAVSGMSPASRSTTPATAIASVPPSGPYDPNGYKASEPFAVAPSIPFDGAAGNPLRTAAATVDRYSMPTANSQTQPVDSPYAAASAAASVSAAATPKDRYVLPTVAATNSQQTDTGSVSSSVAAAPPKNSPEAAFANSPAPAASQPAASQPAVVTNAIDVAPDSASTVQLSTPAGKFRPGGTSDYTAANATDHIEVASLPDTAKPTSPAGTSVPWSPPSAAPADTERIGTY
jgi:hypothetical protein